MPEWADITAWNWPQIAAVAIVIVSSLAGVILTVITLPGTWITVVSALGVKLWQPWVFPWWVIVLVIVLALIGEAVEFGASALGAAKGGATKKGALGAIVGSIVGAILGSPIFFPIGTIAGGVLGAGVGALVMERAASNKTWTEAGKAGTGAAIGRLIATLAKTSLAAAIAMILCVMVFFPDTPPA